MAIKSGIIECIAWKSIWEESEWFFYARMGSVVIQLSRALRAQGFAIWYRGSVSTTLLVYSGLGDPGSRRPWWTSFLCSLPQMMVLSSVKITMAPESWSELLVLCKRLVRERTWTLSVLQLMFYTPAFLNPTCPQPVVSPGSTFGQYVIATTDNTISAW